MKTDDIRYEFYANLTEPVKTISIFIYDITLPIADNSYLIIAYLSVIGLFVNFFHIFILSRKSMRQSSVNVLMIGQSISDIICFSYKTTDIPVVKNFLETNNECDPPVSYFWVLGLYNYRSLDSICRRIPPWIGVVMATFRLLISSFPLNNTIGKLGKPIFSLYSIIILFVISTTLIVPLYMQRTIKITGQWVPKKSCGYPANYSQAIYELDDKYEYDEEFFTDWFLGTSVFVNLPPILLPFITIGLIRVLKKHEKNRAQLCGSSNEVTRHNTTRLVVIMTVCLMVTEGSFRGADALGLFVEEGDFATLFIIINLYTSFQIFYPLNSIAHFFINMLLSSEYRKCIKESFKCFNSCGPDQGSSQSRNRESTRKVTTRMT